MNKFLSSIIITTIFVVVVNLISDLLISNIKNIVVLLIYGFIIFSVLFNLYIILLKKYCLGGEKER